MAEKGGPCKVWVTKVVNGKEKKVWEWASSSDRELASTVTGTTKEKSLELLVRTLKQQLEKSKNNTRESWDREKEELQQRLSEMQLSITRMEGDIATLTVEKDSAASALKIVNDELVAERQRAERLFSESGGVQQKYDDLFSKFSTLTEEARVGNLRIEELETELNAMKSRSDDSLASIDKLRSQLDEAQSNKDTESSRHEKELKALTDQLKEVTDQLSQSKRLADEQNAMLSSLRNANRDLTGQIGELEDKLKSNDALEKALDEANAAHNQDMAMKEEAFALTVSRLEKEVLSLEEGKASLKAELEQAKQKNDELLDAKGRAVEAADLAAQERIDRMTAEHDAALSKMIAEREQALAKLTAEHMTLVAKLEKQLEETQAQQRSAGDEMSRLEEALSLSSKEWEDRVAQAEKNHSNDLVAMDKRIRSMKEEYAAQIERVNNSLREQVGAKMAAEMAKKQVVAKAKELERICAGLLSQQRMKDNHYKGMSAELERLKETNQCLLDEVASSRDDRHHANNEVVHLKERADQLLSRLEDCQKKYEDEFKNRESLQALLTRAREKEDEYKAEIAKWRVKVQDVEGRLNQWDQKVSSEIHSFSRDLEMSRNGFAEAKLALEKQAKEDAARELGELEELSSAMKAVLNRPVTRAAPIVGGGGPGAVAAALQNRGLESATGKRRMSSTKLSAIKADLSILDENKPPLNGNTAASGKAGGVTRKSSSGPLPGDKAKLPRMGSKKSMKAQK